MPGPNKGVSTQRTNQQALEKPRHQPSKRDKQARDRLRNKAKIKSCAYICDVCTSLGTTQSDKAH